MRKGAEVIKSGSKLDLNGWDREKDFKLYSISKSFQNRDFYKIKFFLSGLDFLSTVLFMQKYVLRKSFKGCQLLHSMQKVW